MNNLKRFKKCNQLGTDHGIMAPNLLDDRRILSEHGAYDPTRRTTASRNSSRSTPRRGRAAGWTPHARLMTRQPTGWAAESPNWEPLLWGQPGQLGGAPGRRDGLDGPGGPFHTLQELEKRMPQLPHYEEVREWYQPVIRQTSRRCCGIRHRLHRRRGRAHHGCLHLCGHGALRHRHLRSAGAGGGARGGLHGDVLRPHSAGLRRGDRGAAPLHGREHRRQQEPEVSAPAVRKEGLPAAGNESPRPSKSEA